MWGGFLIFPEAQGTQFGTEGLISYPQLCFPNLLGNKRLGCWLVGSSASRPNAIQF
jgi:hypothetical protein